VPYLAEELKDPYSAVRYIAARSLRSLNGEFRAVDYDFMASDSDRVVAAQKIGELWTRGRGGAAVANRPALLLANGELQLESFERLLKERNQLPIDLQE